ncbi:MAG: hypothetical protein ACOC3D_00750 [Pseudomonadota bacterium]
MLMFLRLSVPAASNTEAQDLAAFRRAVIPESTYGTPLQNFAVPGVRPEGRMAITYEEIPVELGDGEVVHLRKPCYAVAKPAYGPSTRRPC